MMMTLMMMLNMCSFALARVVSKEN